MIHFDPDWFYDEDTLRILGLDSDALARARRVGVLHCCHVRRVRLYKGEWLQQWLAALQEEGRRTPAAPPAGNPRPRQAPPSAS
jgi:hypothetical protein